MYHCVLIAHIILKRRLFAEIGLTFVILEKVIVMSPDHPQCRRSDNSTAVLYVIFRTIYIFWTSSMSNCCIISSGFLHYQ